MGNPTVIFSGTLSPSAVLTTPFAPLIFCNVVTSGTNSVPCAVLPDPDLATNADTTLTTFSLQLTNPGNKVLGAVAGDSIVLNLNYAETAIPPTVPTPESSTFGLMSIGIMGIILFSTKKKFAF